jgi:hypothetical protein
MSDRDEEKLNALLEARPIEAARPDLAERIILRAQSTPQNLTIPWLDRLKGLFAEFHLARPGYVLACTLILGFVLGLSTPLEIFYVADGNSETIPIHTFLYAEEDVL